MRLTELKDSLHAIRAATALKEHTFLQRMGRERFSREQIRIVLSQWYHPLHFFPTFLARHIALSPTMEAKTFVSKILWQELGEGSVERSHQAIYIQTMAAVGYMPAEFVDIEPFAATHALVQAYSNESGEDFLTSLGYLFATEDADLVMVGSIGAAVRRYSERKALPWVDIHVRQEPDHTRSVADTLARGLDSDQLAKVARGADRMFFLWSDFFSDLERAVEKASGR